MKCRWLLQVRVVHFVGQRRCGTCIEWKIFVSFYIALISVKFTSEECSLLLTFISIRSVSVPFLIWDMYFVLLMYNLRMHRAPLWNWVSSITVQHWCEYLLSPHADRHAGDISFTVCLFLFFVCLSATSKSQRPSRLSARTDKLWLFATSKP